MTLGTDGFSILAHSSKHNVQCLYSLCHDVVPVSATVVAYWGMGLVVYKKLNSNAVKVTPTTLKVNMKMNKTSCYSNASFQRGKNIKAK